MAIKHVQKWAQGVPKYGLATVYYTKLHMLAQ